jgi:hypothetical protein
MAKIGVFHNIACISVDMRMFKCYSCDTPAASYTEIRRYIRKKYGKCVSNLNVSQAKERLGLSRTEYKGREASGKYEQPKLNEDKYELIREAFEHFGMI